MEELRKHLRWLLVLRIFLLFFFLVGTGVFLLSEPSGFGPARPWVFAVVVAAGAWTARSLRRLRAAKELGGEAQREIAVDVVLISGAVLLTGGTSSPFSFLYALAILNGACLLHTKGAVLAGFLSSLSYATIAVFGPADDLLPELSRAALHVSSFCLLSYLATLLTGRFHETRELLARERRRSEELRRWQEAVSAGVDCALVTTDVGGTITLVNDVAARLFGKPKDELPGTAIEALLPALALPPEAKLALLQQGGRTVEMTHTGAGGSRRTLRCSAIPLFDTYRTRLGVLYVLQETEDSYFEDERREAPEDDGPFAGILGKSPRIRGVRRLVRQVAPTDATVLLQGESGTGKEVVARAIHARSPRASKPFVAVNCGAIPEHLVESELFGHEKGAFTGAVARRGGLFRAADGGTIFLDEIGDLPFPLQVKLLRVLEERTFVPVGGERPVVVDVRVLAATNKNLEEEVRAGRFREDLFYRLDVVRIDLPPLRERREDIPVLVRHFVREFSVLHRKNVTKVSRAAARRFLEHDYPGNVRELANMVEHAVTLAEGDTIRAEDLPERTRPLPRGPLPEPPEDGGSRDEPALPNDLDRHLADYEKAILERALERTGGVKKRAAALLGLNYRSFRHRLTKYRMNGSSVDGEPTVSRG
ncbi:MAG: hypothetical protein KatS3mg076_1140 [Candidatus Binatia bacterium]|nr:MAG: hypothetical protein KatS3mg076_1140 [Candidatus Binatia bacterium]